MEIGAGRRWLLSPEPEAHLHVVLVTGRQGLCPEGTSPWDFPFLVTALRPDSLPPPEAVMFNQSLSLQ